MKLVLIGYMGCGKSFLGKALAKKMQIPFIDLDEFIESETGKTISELFAEKGEIFFRKTETRFLEVLLKNKKNAVIALGGGTPCYSNNLELLKLDAQTKTVYLKTDIETLSLRLFEERKSRPLISHLNHEDELKEFIAKHLFERSFYYNQSDVIVNTNDFSSQDLLLHLETLI